MREDEEIVAWITNELGGLENTLGLLFGTISLVTEAEIAEMLSVIPPTRWPAGDPFPSPSEPRASGQGRNQKEDDDMSDGEWIITNFELDEQVFVPAGGGEPAQWKPRGDLTAEQIDRYLEGGDAALARYGERIERWKAIGDEAKKRGFAGERTLDEFLSPARNSMSSRPSTWR